MSTSDILGFWPFLTPIVILVCFFIVSEWMDRRAYREWQRRMMRRDHIQWAERKKGQVPRDN